MKYDKDGSGHYYDPIHDKWNRLDIEGPKPGIYAAVPHNVYLNINAISRSKCSDFLKAPEYFLNPENPEKDHFAFGTQYHAYMFEPDVFKEKFHEGTVTAQGRRGKAFREEQEEHGFNYVYKPQDLEKFEGMYAALRDNYERLYKVLNSDNPKELTIVFYHEESGLMCKVKIDILMFEAGWLIDLKATKAAIIDEFRWSIKNFKYDFQAGFYVNACQRTPGLEHVNNFAIIAQEKEAPYIARSHNMIEHVADGIIEADRVLVEIADWMKAGSRLPDEMSIVPKYSMS